MFFWKSSSLNRVSPETTRKRRPQFEFANSEWVRVPFLVVFFAVLIWSFHVILWYPDSISNIINSGVRLFLTGACVFSFYGLLYVERNPVLSSIPKLVLYGFLILTLIGVTGGILRYQSEVFQTRSILLSQGQETHSTSKQAQASPPKDQQAEPLSNLLQDFIRSSQSAFFVPLTLLVMLIAVGFTTSLAIETLFFLVLLLGLLWGPDLHFSSFFSLSGHAWFLMGFISCLPGAVVGAVLSSDIRHRTKPIEAGVLAGGIHFLIYGLLLLAIFPASFLSSLKLSSTEFLEIAKTGGYALLNGAASGAFLLLVLPYVEKIFGAKTDLGLLELTDMNRPALRKLALDAPGTYHHSLRVSTLSEEAAEAIGANSLLARVGAYYHDIGKVTKPQYFIENQQGEGSPHEDLPSNMSKLILLGHVKDGLELADYYGLPDDIKAFIEQHHGTSVIEYFFDKERRIQEQREEGQDVETSDFRYPGPKPQTREIGICMLADAVEATSRSLSDPSPGQIDGIVGRIIRKRILDGQLDESGLTMGDIKIIKRSFLEVLSGMMHMRIKYPDQQDVAPEPAVHERDTERIPAEEMPPERQPNGDSPGDPESISPALPNQVDILNQQDEIDVDLETLQELGRFVLNAEGVEKRISAVLVSRDEIQELHETYLGKNEPTDVLSFPLESKEESSPDELLGEIITCPREARIQSRKNDISLESELCLYLIHGILHLLGYDDQEEQERQKMKTREQELLEAFQGQKSGQDESAETE